MDKFKVNLGKKPDFKMEAIICLYDRKWNQVRAVTRSEVKYGKSREFLENEFSRLALYRDTVIDEIEKSGFDFSFLDRFVQPDVEKFPYLLRLYFFSEKNPDKVVSDEEVDALIGDFVADWINETVEADGTEKIIGIEELYRTLDNPLIAAEDRMLILDTFANRKRLLSDLRAYFSIAVPVLENNFHIIRAEFEVYLKEYEKITDWRDFYDYYSIRFDKDVQQLDVTLSVLLFNKIRSMTTVGRGDYSSVGMRYNELKEWERIALVSNGVLLEYMKALSDGTRLRMLSELRQRKMRVKDIARELKLTAPTISHHISILLRIGIITASMSHSESGVCEYSVSADRIDDICELLSKLK